MSGQETVLDRTGKQNAALDSAGKLIAGLAGYRPNVRLRLENEKYLAKTAEDGAELMAILRLRHDVFYGELIGKPLPWGLDIDRFDALCDHVVVIDKESGDFAGAYRFNCSLFNRDFYSATEFDIENVLRLDGRKLELGRACVHPQYRRGPVVVMLWKAIGEYINLTGARYLFGCSSINTTNIAEIAGLHGYFKAHIFGDERCRVFPRPGYRIDALERFATAENTETATRMLPPLLKLYMKAGAVICGAPALDREFRCADFFTLLDASVIDGNIDARYRKCGRH